ncbi:MAG: selenide, water dikinase SelD [Gammaproteobacteria bacterium]|nr:selenide, water dikinase SelD [Gammaproteobacteria bacterium]
MTTMISSPSVAATGLRALAGCGGCAAKLDPLLVSALAAAAQRVNLPQADVLCGLDPADDAAVYRLDDDRALVSTIDFFPPLVYDPAYYGAVAAANALSDVYAMGGEVAFALVIAGFPASIPQHVVETVIAAASAVVAECGAVVLGGHSVRCQEPVFGLAVTGFVHPERIWRKRGARPGDVLMLSKALGIGLLLSHGSDQGLAQATAAMRVTNRAAAEALRTLPEPPGAVTDVTGYGLVGHALEMARHSGVRLHLEAARLPWLEGARAAAESGVRTSADARLRAAGGDHVVFAGDVAAAVSALCHDPQTSGGLLAAVAPEARRSLESQGFTMIGQVEAGEPAVLVT